MDELVNTTKNDLSVPERQGRALRISRATEGIDFKGMLARLVQFADMGHIVSSLEKASQYVVEVPLQYQEALNDGLLEINRNKETGVLWPTLVKRLENGRKEFEANLPIRKEDFIKGNPMHELATNMQNMYLQQQLAQLTQLVKETFETVQRIERGQTNDRIGLLRSGYEGVQIALTHDGEQRQRGLELAREQIREARGRIGEELKSRLENFNPIPSSFFRRQLKLIADVEYLNKANNEYHVIQKYYALYLRATKLLAATYILCNETKAAEMAYNQSVDLIREMDFSKIASIRHIHASAKEEDLFYLNAERYLFTEKAICLEQAKTYDYIEVSVSGTELLEAINNNGE